MKFNELPARPRLTADMISAAAQRFCADNGWNQDMADDLANTNPSLHACGYELAKELDNRCGWSPSAQDVEVLDGFGQYLREELQKAVQAWADATPIEPPLPIGTMTDKGEITGIYEYEPACYLVKKPNDPIQDRRYIVKFEDACAVEWNI